MIRWKVFTFEWFEILIHDWEEVKALGEGLLPLSYYPLIDSDAIFISSLQNFRINAISLNSIVSMKYIFREIIRTPLVFFTSSNGSLTIILSIKLLYKQTVNGVENIREFGIIFHLNVFISQYRTKFSLCSA